jgi:hypothetical protein
MNDFVVHRLRSKPVEYTVSISHYVRDGQWVMHIAKISDITVDKENMLRVAADLRMAASWIEEDFGTPPRDDNEIPPEPGSSQYVSLEPQPLPASDDTRDV